MNQVKQNDLPTEVVQLKLQNKNVVSMAFRDTSAIAGNHIAYSHFKHLHYHDDGKPVSKA